eukprot:357584-Chlamydomonas_euryale.AAC.3
MEGHAEALTRQPSLPAWRCASAAAAALKVAHRWMPPSARRRPAPPAQPRRSRRSTGHPTLRSPARPARLVRSTAQGSGPGLRFRSGSQSPCLSLRTESGRGLRLRDKVQVSGLKGWQVAATV